MNRTNNNDSNMSVLSDRVKQYLKDGLLDTSTSIMMKSKIENQIPLTVEQLTVDGIIVSEIYVN